MEDKIMKTFLTIVLIFAISFAGFAQEEVKEQKQEQTKTQVKEQTKAQNQEQVKTETQVKEQTQRYW